MPWSNYQMRRILFEKGILNKYSKPRVLDQSKQRNESGSEDDEQQQQKLRSTYNFDTGFSKRLPGSSGHLSAAFVAARWKRSSLQQPRVSHIEQSSGIGFDLSPSDGRVDKREHNVSGVHEGTTMDRSL